MTRHSSILAAAVIALVASSACKSSMLSDNLPVNEITPPSIPLVTVDPYFSVWSNTDVASQSPTTHWTGKDKPVICAVRVDGTVYRLLGTVEPEKEVLLPTISAGDWKARYIIDKQPAEGWTEADFDDSSWKEGEGAFGSPEMPGVKTLWQNTGSDIWVRRTVELKEDLDNCPLMIEYSHDDVFELYVNGKKLADTGNTWKNGLTVMIPDDVKAGLKAGSKLSIAAHCHNTTGGAYVDFGLFRLSNDQYYSKTASQKSYNVLPTRTIYLFECGGIDLELSFTAPLLMDDLDLMSRPVNYLTWNVRSNDGNKHEVQVCVEASPEMAVDKRNVAVTASSYSEGKLDILKTGSVDQPVLKRKGDNVRIDWGYFLMAAPSGSGKLAISDYKDAKAAFTEGGNTGTDLQSVTVKDSQFEPLSLQYVKDFGIVGSKIASDYVMLAYDDVFSIQYFKENLRPYWNRKGDKTIESVLSDAAAMYDDIMERCSEFDVEMMADAGKAGGKKYAELCALAYRQAISAHKLVESPQGDLLFLSKENFSNGSIGTVDVTYPSAPLFLLYNPELCKGLLNHIFYYSESGKWDKPFAAHDVGTYPHANGQTYGGDMPVEECGNMIVLTGAIAVIEGNADYAAKHWETLTSWTKYLVEFGQDPDWQLCTDDFAGHSAHNTNLSIKAIEGIAAYAEIARMLGKNDIADEYMAMARKMAGIWKETAADGDHYRLGFDREGSWSQKYNLVWDRMLGFNVFDPSIAQTEIAYYKTRQNEYGLPLDCRSEYTKTDWIVWSATMADSPDDFNCLVDRIWKFMDESEDRVPMSDWVHTDRAVHVGFQARSVVGGYFIKMLDEKLKN